MEKQRRDARRAKNNVKSTLNILGMLACIILIAYLATLQMKSSEPTPPPSDVEWHVFLAGTNGYTDNIPFLESAERDVDELRRLFKELGAKDENIVVLKTENPDIGKTTAKKYLLKQYDRFLDGLTEKSIAFVFLSGHGFSEKDKSYYAPRDFSRDEKDETSVSIDDMLKKLSKTKACFKWMCVDACRTRLESGERGLEESVLSIESVPRGVLLTQSCKDGQASYEPTPDLEEDEEKRHGVFTLALVEAVESSSPEADADLDGNVTLGELRDYLEERVPKDVRKYYPRGVQNPEFTVGKNGSFEELSGYVLFKNRSVPGWNLLHGAKSLIKQSEEFDKEGNDSGAKDVLEEARQKLEKAKSLYPHDKEIASLYEEVSEKLSDNEDGVSQEPDNEMETRTLTIAGCDVKFIKVPAGTFTMGQGGDKADQREVTVASDFWLAETETTQRLWQAVMGENPSEFKGDDLPVEKVSWDDCQKFLAAIQRYAPVGMSFKLPSEEHWEYACRAGSLGLYWWGDDVEGGKGKLNGYDQRGKESEGMGWEPLPFDDGYAKTAPVGSFEPNAWGFKDMLGNVREWCDDVVSGDPSKHIIRGGGWNFLTSKCQSGAKESGVSGLRSNYLGFRLELSEAIYEPEILTVEIGDDPKETVNFVWIPAGTFTMGSPEESQGRDSWEVQREVSIPTGFWLAETETTQALWLAVMGDNPSEFKGEKYSLDHPVENVSWDDCQAFIAKIQKYAPSGKKFKLPSEEHWEYACRAGRQSAYWWGEKPEGGEGKANVYDLCAHEVYHRETYSPFEFNDGYSETAPVGSFDANPWGLKDMVGSVWEWCEDSWHEQLPEPDLDAMASSEARSAIRGGSWDSYWRRCRSAHRAGLPNDSRANYLGFRLEMIDESAQ